MDRRYRRDPRLLLVFVIPFLFMLINSLKERREANKLSLALPSNVEWNNFIEVIQTNDYQIFNAFKNSILLTAGAVLLLVIVLPWRDM